MSLLYNRVEQVYSIHLLFINNLSIYLSCADILVSKQFACGVGQYYSVLHVCDRVGPLCGKYYNISPYAYCNGNSANFFDKDGRKGLNAVQ